MNTNIYNVSDRLKIGAFDVDVSRNQLVRNGRAYPLEPQIMNLLCGLAQMPSEVFSREKLIERVWGVEYGGDESLTRAVSILRKTFKKAGEKTPYIETIYKRGYRLKVRVSKPDTPIETQQALTPRANEISIAVLPFVDMSKKGNQAYFSNGVSEEILNSLARLSFLRVTGRTSSFSFRDQSVPIREIAKALNVSHILEGSVRKIGDQLRITVQLILAKEDKHIWSETFDGGLDDVFELQEIIARAVEQELNSIFGASDSPQRKQNFRKMTTSIQAYDFFIQGRGLTQQQDGPETLPKAIEMLKMAVTLDPKFAEAWAYLARAHFYSLEHTRTPNWTSHIVAGRGAVTRALDINPDLDIAQSTMGYLALLDLKIDERLIACEKAYTLNPNSPVFAYTYGSALASIGQSERGLKFMETALKQEPLSASWINGLGHPKFALGKLDGAAADYQHSFDLGYDSALFMHAILMKHRGKSKEAIDTLQSNIPHMGFFLSSIVPAKFLLRLYIYASYGNSKVARSLAYVFLRALVINPKTQPTASLSFRCYALDFPKLFMASVRAHPHPYLGAALAQLWTPTIEAKRIRTHKDFPKFADDIGLVRGWQAYGWPKTIKPIHGTDGSDGKFTCT